MRPPGSGWDQNLYLKHVTWGIYRILFKMLEANGAVFINFIIFQSVMNKVWIMSGKIKGSDIMIFIPYVQRVTRNIIFFDVKTTTSVSWHITCIVNAIFIGIIKRRDVSRHQQLDCFDKIVLLVHCQGKPRPVNSLTRIPNTERFCMLWRLHVTHIYRSFVTYL